MKAKFTPELTAITLGSAVTSPAFAAHTFA